MLQDFHAVFSKKKQLTHDIVQFHFALPGTESLAFVAGQYLVLRFGDTRRNYSIATVASQNKEFEIIAQIFPNGAASAYLQSLLPGDKVLFQGPAGHFVFKDSGRDKIFLATGTGIAPMHSLFLSHLPRPGGEKWTLLWGLRTLEDLYFLEELTELSQKYPHFSFQIYLSQEKPEHLKIVGDKRFMIGRVTRGLEEKLRTQNHEPITNADFYICGNYLIVESLRQHLLGLGISKESILFEKFT